MAYSVALGIGLSSQAQDCRSIYIWAVHDVTLNSPLGFHLHCPFVSRVRRMVYHKGIN